MTAFPFELMIALMHLIGEGVFDRFPKLKVAFMQGACVPFGPSAWTSTFTSCVRNGPF